MGTIRTDEFRKDAVRITLGPKDQKTVRGTVFPEDGLSRKQIADDLGVGMVTTDSDHAFNIAPNRLDRDFTADRPNQKWAGDIGYIWTREAWLYLAVILDLHFRRVIGWALSNRMNRDLAIRALKLAIALRSPPKHCIFHSDRGSQDCSHDYQKVLRKHVLKASMSGLGNCYDNAAVGTFLKTIKAELIWRRTRETRRQTETAIFQFINGLTRAVGIQHWEQKATWLSDARRPKRALGAARIRDKTRS